MLIPIGSWCRVAYQVNEFKKRLRVKPVAYPYDWTITPFSALKLTLDKDFISENVLHQDNLVLSKFGSILDSFSQLIHLYDFNPQKLKELGKSGGFNENNIPVRLFKSELVDKAQARFRNAYNNLQSHKNNEKKLAFVRWNRFGHPDPHLPYAFKGESNSAIAEILSGYLNSDNFSILQVKSKVIDGNISEKNIIISFKKEDIGYSATIAERRGFNGDGKNDFRGDTASWNKLLNRFIDAEGIEVG